MKYLLFPLVLMLCTGCNHLRHTDDRQWRNITCSGASASWQDCWKQAKNMCPSGYDYTNQRMERGSLLRSVDVACK